MGEIKQIDLKNSNNIDTTHNDLVNWDMQTQVLGNNGIERDGGITNLYTQIESNSAYEESYYTRNGKKVRLLRDDINNWFRVFSNEMEVGQVPQWAVEDRRVLTIDASDVMATISGTFLVLRLSALLATIQEVDASFNLIRSRSFAIPANISDGMLVRNKAPTWANVTSMAGIFANSNKLNHNIITDGGTVYAITNQNGFVNSSQVFAYYENGWIVCAQDKTDGRTFLLNSAGVQQGTYTEATMMSANYNQGTLAVTFIGYRDVITLGTPAVYGNVFTPPAAPLGVWTITAKTNAAATPVAQFFTFGGYELAYGSATKSLFYSNNTAVDRLWTIGHSTASEIYGYLDNGADVAFKTHTILGDGAYLSASFNPDGIGVPITEIGELNGFYYPQILKKTDGAYQVVYRRGNGSYATIKLSRDVTFNRLQEIAPGVVKINTISALCVADANDNDLQFSGNAYNGFVVIGFDAVAPVQKAFVARYRGEYGGSVDANYKSTGAVLVGSPTLIVIPESVNYSANNETIDVYYGPPPASLAYYRSVRDGIAQSVKGNLIGTNYVDDLIVPPPQGVTYSEQTIALIWSTAVRDFNYDGYQLLNETIGQYQSFRLYGQLYLFDGDWIHSAQLSGNILQRIDHVANALGLVFLAESPTAIFFYSSFDNSIYTFDGGQAVQKQNRFTQKPMIRRAAHNPRENTLGLFLDDSVIWIRDGIMTESFLPFSYPYNVFSTSDGIWISQNKYAIKYLYNAIAGGGVVISLDLDGGIWGSAYADTVDGGIWGTPYADTYDGATWGESSGIIDPLVWRSNFLGYTDKTKQNLDRYTFRVYKQDKAQSAVTFDYSAYNENGKVTESKSVTIGDANNPYDTDGYAFIEFIPANKNAIASSIQLTCNDKIVLVDGYAEVTTAGGAVAKNRS